MKQEPWRKKIVFGRSRGGAAPNRNVGVGDRRRASITSLRFVLTAPHNHEVLHSTLPLLLLYFTLLYFTLIYFNLLYITFTSFSLHLHSPLLLLTSILLYVTSRLLQLMSP